MNCTQGYVMESFVGDPPEDIVILAASDASFAGDLRTSRSTTGGFLAMFGPNTFAPITAICKKQTVVSHSTAESEIIALDTVLRTEGLPLLTLWEIIVDVFGQAAAGRPARGRWPRAATQSRTIGPSHDIAAGRPGPTAKLIVAEDNDAVIKIITDGPRGHNATCSSYTQSCYRLACRGGSAREHTSQMCFD